MMNPSTFFNGFDEPFIADFDPLTAETVNLSGSSLQWAGQMCQILSEVEQTTGQSLDPDQQWQTFLTALAVAGFEQWLQSGAITPNLCRRLTDSLTSGVNLWVDGFRICILAMGSLSDDQVSISETVFIGESNAHIVVLVEVQEEVSQVRILAGLRPEVLSTQLGQYPMVENHCYQIPIDQFQVTPEQLLLYLNCLEPEVTRATTIDRIGQQMAVGAAGLTASILNVGRWFNDQLDEVANQWNWVLLPPLAVSPMMRSQPQQIEDILAELVPQHIEIPADAKGARTRLQLAEAAVQLYALTWPLPETDEWSLLLLLGPEADDLLPNDIYLQVHDPDGLIAEEHHSQDSTVTFLYAQVIGIYDEVFTVQIGFPDGPMIALPPFAFKVE